jgi:predicted unusual protein kinase regulating ubiquinone biosynthesis (AarF/ABC1/UbiB family)
MEGDHLNEWLKTHPNTKQRHRLARQLMDLFYYEIFELRLVQTDPNLGNFKIQKDQLVLLDFGACKVYSSQFVKRYQELVLCSRTQDWSMVLKRSIEFGMLSAQEPPEAQELFIEMMKSSFVPFLKGQQPFDFNNLSYVKELRAKTTEFIRAIKYSAPPHELIFLQRKLLGIFNVLRTLNVQVDLTEWIDKIEQVSLKDSL